MLKAIKLIPLVFLCQNLLAQGDCFQVLSSAERLYYLGEFQSIEPVVSGCINSGFTKTQKTEAYRLLSLGYIFSRRTSKADSCLLLLLQTDPKYVPGPKDPPEFVNRLNRIDRNPVISWGPRAGLNISLGRTLNEHHTTTSGSSSFTGKAGFHLGLSSSFHITPKLWLGFDLLLEERNFEIAKEELFDGTSYRFSVMMTEKQFRLEMPVKVRYVTNIAKLRPFVEVGIGVTRLLSSTGQITNTNNSTSIRIAELDYDLTDFRSAWNYSPMFAIGDIVNVPGGFIEISLRYAMNSQYEKGPRPKYDDPRLVSALNYVDDDFISGTLSLSAAFIWSVYKPKLKKS